MNATFLYVKACKCMLSISDEIPSNWNELFQLLPKLRQSLSCRVCRGLLVEPFGSESCEHYVCRGCLRKKRSLNPGCRWCLNMDILVADKQTRVLLACYQKLCEFIANSGAVGHLKSQNGEYNAIVAVIHEALASPIAMEDCIKDQVKVPATKIIDADVWPPAMKNSSGKSNDKMADESHDCVTRLPAEVIKPLPKRKVIQLLKEIDGNEDQKPKRKKKKHFKGTIYNYNKKKKLKKMSDEKDPESIVCPQYMETVQTIEDDEDSNEEVQVVDEIDEKPLFTKTELSAPTAAIQLRARSCRCGVASMGLLRKCIGKRCPCYTQDRHCCEHCSCCNCANPFNNNNDKPTSVLENITVGKNFAVPLEQL